MKREMIAKLEGLFSQQADSHSQKLNDTIVLEAAEAWFVVSGQIDLFIVTTERGEVSSAWDYFGTLESGALMLGLDFEEDSQVRMLANFAMETKFFRVPIDRIRQIVADGEQRALVCELIDGWVADVSEGIARGIQSAPRAERILVAGQETKIRHGEIARAARSVGWLRLSHDALFLGTENVQWNGKAFLTFPVAPSAWIEAIADSEIKTLSAQAASEQGLLWNGILRFRAVAAQCIVINLKLRYVDDFNLLQRRAAFDDWSRASALRDIGSVLRRGDYDGASIDLFGDQEDQLLSACKLVGSATGIDIVAPPGLRKTRDKVSAIAKASRCRYREVALRDEWWKTDSGPLLAYRSESNEPVALIPRNTAYELVDPKSLQRAPLHSSNAGMVQPIGVMFYRSLPDNKLTFKDLVKFGLHRSKKDLWVIVGMGVFVGLLGMVTPYFSGQILDQLIPSANRTALLNFTIGLIVAAFGTFAFELVRAIAVLRLEGQMDSIIQAGVISRLLDLPSIFFRKYAAGDLADRALGIEQIRQIISQTGTQALIGSISMMIMFCFLFTYNWKMALIAMIPLTLSVILPIVANLFQLRLQRQLFHLRGNISGLLLQLFNGINKLKVAGAEDRAFRQWSSRFARQKKLAFRAGKLTNVIQIYNQVIPLLCSAFVFGVYAYFQYQALKEHTEFKMSTGQFVAFNATLSAILWSLLQLSTSSLDLMMIVPVAERLKPIIETIPEIDSAKAHPGTLSGEIEVWHVTFRYLKDGPAILKDVSFRVAPGEYVALVGGSGSGKSTLLRILLGFEKPESGSVFYDGQDLTSLDIREVRQQVGVVLQTSRLMPTDIFRNIVGSSNLSMEAAWEAARMSGLDRDIKQMPMGMHTVVSEGGGTFSGGQRQRLMIARALVRKPRIVFFDEATSALDNETQSVVTESLDSMQATRIVIAHRLSTIVKADRIVVLQNGELLQQGRYEELLRREGPFAELAKRQMA